MNFEDVTVGCEITYRLKASAWPVNPDRLWRGFVAGLYPRTEIVQVSSMDTGYEGLEELVHISQIVECKESDELVMRQCPYCGQYHYVKLMEFCPLNPQRKELP